MTRRRPDVQPCGERHERYLHCLTCNPVPPERPEKLQGPEVGALCLYQDERYQPEPIVVRIVERSYVWGPGDPAYHGGARRYDWKVIDRGSKGRTVVGDEKLTPIETGAILAPIPADHCDYCNRDYPRLAVQSHHHYEEPASV